MLLLLLQVYKDAVRLQLVYLQERDRLCADGKLLWSPALFQYSLQELLQEEVWLLNMDNIIGEDVISQCLEECAAESVSSNQNFELQTVIFYWLGWWWFEFWLPYISWMC